MAERPWKLNDTFPLSLAMEEEAAAVAGTWGFHDTVPLSLAQQFSAAAGESAGEFWSLWEQAFNEAEAGGAPEIFAQGAATLTLTGAGTATVAVAAQGARSLTLVGAGAAKVDVQAQGARSLTLVGAGAATTAIAAQGAGAIVLQGDGTAELPIAAAGAGTLQLVGAGTVTVESLSVYADVDFGGAGREEFQPRVRRRPRPTTVAGAGKLVLIGRGRAVTTPELAKGFSPSPKQKPLERPLEELREFRILARGRTKLQLVGSGEATASVQGRGHGELTLVGAGTIVRTWPDDTDELVAIMLMLDSEAA